MTLGTYLLESLDCAEHSIANTFLELHLLDLAHQSHDPSQGLSRLITILLRSLAEDLVHLPGREGRYQIGRRAERGCGRTGMKVFGFREMR